MRIALDSSIPIAAHIGRAGVCAELLEDVLLRHKLVIPDFILEELGESSLRKSILPGATLIPSSIMTAKKRPLIDMSAQCSIADRQKQRQPVSMR